MLLKNIKSASTKNRTMSIQFTYSHSLPDGLEVRAFRCARGNKGSTPGLDRYLLANEIFGRGSTQTERKKTTDTSQIHEKVTEQKQYH